MSDYRIRVMTRPEVDTAIAWAAAEGWNPGLHDAECFAVADPNGFLVGVLGDEPIATISVVKYGDSFGFLGLYIVRPEHRGKGYGMRIWEAGLAYLRGRVIGLDGVVAQQLNYRKSGFTLAYRNIRCQGPGGGGSPPDAGIVPLSTFPFGELCAYDKPFFPDTRVQFLREWVNHPGHIGLAVLENRQLAGYGVLRRCHSGYKIGPLFADNAELAERLFVALKARVPATDAVFLDTPAVNPAAVALAARHQMTAVFETARMYTGTIPDLPLERLFGVTTFELG